MYEKCPRCNAELNVLTTRGIPSFRKWTCECGWESAWIQRGNGNILTKKAGVKDDS